LLRRAPTLQRGLPQFVIIRIAVLSGREFGLGMMGLKGFIKRINVIFDKGKGLVH